MSEFFKLLEAVFKLERVLHCNREQAKRFVAACYEGTAYNGKCPGPKLDLFMKGGIFDLFACADDGGRRICKTVADALEADGMRVNVDLDERDEDEDDLGYLTLNVQPGDMSLLEEIFRDHGKVCYTEEDEARDARTASLYQRLTMGADKS